MDEGEPEPSRALVIKPYLKNAARNSSPTRQQVYKKQALARVRGIGDRYDEWKLSFGTWLDGLDLAPDLAENIGSRRWFRGLGTMLGLGAVALAFW
ncbi:MAG: M23 family peptidase, partial [Pseudomonadota bacterium]